MMQWVPYGQTLDEFLAHLRTFLAVFPNVSVIAGPGGNGFFMIGLRWARGPRPGGHGEVLCRAPGSSRTSTMRPTPETVAWRSGVDMALDLRASGDELRTGVGEGPLITDDRPLPEYFLLRRLADPDAPRMSLDGLRALLPQP